MYTHYGNEAADIELCYQSAVILVELPAWGEPLRTLLPSQSASEPAPKAKLESDIAKVECSLDPKAESDRPSLAQPDPYAGGEGLVTCCTRSCPAGMQ